MNRKMNQRMVFPTLVLFAALLACSLPGSAPAEPTVIALPPTPNLPIVSSPIPQNTTPAGSTSTVKLPASACWMESNVIVSAGQVVSITATGTINTWGGNSISFNNPNGQAENICVDPKCPLLNVGYGTLVGRVEDSQPFQVGETTEFTALNSGRLFFTVNDWECADNSGEFDLVITIE